MIAAQHLVLSEGLARCSELSREMRAAAGNDLCRTSGEAMMLRRLADLIEEAVKFWAAGFEAIRPQGLPVKAHVQVRAVR